MLISQDAVIVTTAKEETACACGAGCCSQRQGGSREVSGGRGTILCLGAQG